MFFRCSRWKGGLGNIMPRSSLREEIIVSAGRLWFAFALPWTVFGPRRQAFEAAALGMSGLVFANCRLDLQIMMLKLGDVWRAFV